MNIELDRLLKDTLETIKEEQYYFIVNALLYNKKIMRQENLVSEIGNFNFNHYFYLEDFLNRENFLVKNSSLEDGHFFFTNYLKQIEDNVQKCFFEAFKIYINEYISQEKTEEFISKYNIKLPENNFLTSNEEGKKNILFILSKKQLIKKTKKIFNTVIEDIKVSPTSLIIEEYKQLVINRKNTKDFYEKIKNRKKISQLDNDFLENSKISKLISIEYFLISEIIIDIEDLYKPDFFNEGLKLIFSSLIDKKILTIPDLENFIEVNYPDISELFTKNFK